jgi:dual specificity tyrosine-phosphorylation-regulated kinase 2/3/4
MKGYQSTLVSDDSFSYLNNIYQRNDIDCLCPYERIEIKNYTNIYYCGQNKIKSTYEDFVIDDDNGDLVISPGDQIAYRYETLELIGKGSFGQVIKVKDHKNNKELALKIVRSKKKFYQQALVEVKVLENIKQFDVHNDSNIIHIIESFYFRGHLCMSFELLSMNLYEFLKVSKFKGFSLGLIKKFAVQLLDSLIFLFSLSIIHCDLKPENIVLISDKMNKIKLIDFGSSCFVKDRMYTYIQSRFYRSPEVLLGQEYGHPIDMWSFGCILVELYTGYPIFPGENENDQMLCIMEVLGLPSQEFLRKSPRRKTFFDVDGNPKLLITEKGRNRIPGSRPLEQVLKCTDRNFTNFIRKCLTWDSQTRMTPFEALSHPWISEIKIPSPAAKAIPFPNRRIASEYVNQPSPQRLLNLPKHEMIDNSKLFHLGNKVEKGQIYRVDENKKEDSFILGNLAARIANGFGFKYKHERKNWRKNQQ